MLHPSIQIRRSKERGHANHGWLDSYFSFSFADYYDPKHMHFRSLRVINEDKVAPAMGFGMHPHANMEIFTYIVDGELKHEDSMGHKSVIKAGDVQKISAGTGITHSEFNASKDKPVHLLQIWIMPQVKGVAPSYQEYTLAKPDSKQPLLLIGSPQGGNNVVPFYQDVFIYRGVLSANQDFTHAIKDGRGVWLQLIKGKLSIADNVLEAGDAIAVESLSAMTIKALSNAEFLLFDLA